MTVEDYRKALDAACREYEALSKQRADLDARLTQLAQSIGNLTKLCGYTPTVPWGLTDAVRVILKNAGHPLTALEVRGQLEAMGIDLSKYTSDLAAIHTVLKRLNESGETEFVPRGWGKPTYQWKGPVTPLARSRVRAVEPDTADRVNPSPSPARPGRKARKSR